METQNQSLELSGLDAYYQEEFRKIHESNETYKGRWNWWAFFFTGIWCLLKGCWVLAIIIFLTYSILQFRYQISEHVFIGLGIPALFWSLIMGWRGTWFYYNAKVKKKQLASF
jgi:hypothetical protein